MGAAIPGDVEDEVWVFLDEIPLGIEYCSATPAKYGYCMARLMSTVQNFVSFQQKRCPLLSSDPGPCSTKWEIPLQFLQQFA